MSIKVPNHAIPDNQINFDQTCFSVDLYHLDQRDETKKGPKKVYYITPITNIIEWGLKGYHNRRTNVQDCLFCPLVSMFPLIKDSEIELLYSLLFFIGLNL